MTSKTGQSFIKWFQGKSTTHANGQLTDFVWGMDLTQAFNRAVYDTVKQDCEQVCEWLGIVPPAGMSVVSLKVRADGLTDKLEVDVTFSTSQPTYESED